MPRRADDPNHSGYGLFSLQERLELLGGQVQIDSTPGKTTRVQITVPLPAAHHTPTAEPHVEADSAPKVPAEDTDPAAPAGEYRTRVLLTDDHEVVRRGLANLIKQQPDMQVVAEADSGENAVKLAHQHRPEVVIMDISLPGISGIETTRRIMAELPQTCVIGISMHHESDVAEDLQRAGARVYLNKSQAAEKLLEAIRMFAPRERPQDPRRGQLE